MRVCGGAGELGRADGVSTIGVSVVIVLRPVVIVGGVGLIFAAVVTVVVTDIATDSVVVVVAVVAVTATVTVVVVGVSVTATAVAVATTAVASSPS